MTSIFVAEGAFHVREALRLLLEHQPGFVVLGEAGTTESMLAQVCARPPDLILLDWCMPGMNPGRLLEALRQCCPQTLIIATSVKPEHGVVALEYGVDAFLSQQLAPDQFVFSLMQAIQTRVEKNILSRRIDEQSH